MPVDKIVFIVSELINLQYLLFTFYFKMRAE